MSDEKQSDFEFPGTSQFHDDIQDVARKEIQRANITSIFKTSLDPAYDGGDPKTIDLGEDAAADETGRIVTPYSYCNRVPGEDVYKVRVGGGFIVLGTPRARPEGDTAEGGYILLPNPSPETAPTNTAWTANQIRGIRLPVRDSIVAVSIHFEVSANAQAGCLASAALYSSDRSTRVAYSGPIDCSTNGIKQGDSLVGWIPGGGDFYWLIFTANDSVTQFRTIIDSNTALTNLINDDVIQRATFGSSTGAVLPSSLTTPSGASFATFPLIKIQG